MTIQNNSKQIALFLTAQTISLFGSSLVQYAIIWHVALTTNSGLMMMFATMAAFLPQIVVSFFAGVWIDKYDRKKIIMISDGVIALVTLLLALCFLSGFKSVWLLFVVLCVRSAGTGIQTPAVNAFIPQLVAPSRLMRVNSIYNTLGALMMVLPPAIGALILTFLSIEATFFIDVITAVIGVGITSLIVAAPYKKHNEEISTYVHQLKSGITYVKNHPLVKHLLIYQLIVLFLVSPAAFLTPLMVMRSFGPELWRLSLNEITFGGGALLGGVLLSLWGGFHNKIHTTLLAGFLYGLCMILMAILPNFWIYLAINLGVGILLPFYNTPITTILQERVSARMHGRVFSFMNIVVAAALPLGMVIFGPIADIISIQNILISCGIALSAVGYWVYKNQKWMV